MSPRHEDAVLMVQLAQWSTALGLSEAGRVVFSADFDPETADAEDHPVAAFLEFGETVGTLVKNDLFSRDLADDWIWWTGLWERIGPAARRQRAALGATRLYENLEALAAGRAP